MYGSIIGLLVSSWIVAMSQYYKSKGIIVDVPKPTFIDGCYVNATEIPSESLLLVSTALTGNDSITLGNIQDSSLSTTLPVE